MNDLVSECMVYYTGKNNGTAWVKVYETKKGYAIESFLRDRSPQVQKTYYKNTEFFDAYATMYPKGWSDWLLYIHGKEEMLGTGRVKVDESLEH